MPSSRSQPRTRMRSAASSTDSIRSAESASWLGRCGARVAKTPRRVPSPARRLDEAAPIRVEVHVADHPAVEAVEPAQRVLHRGRQLDLGELRAAAEHLRLDDGLARRAEALGGERTQPIGVRVMGSLWVGQWSV